MTDSFTAHRRLLFGLAYRMLGRVAAAEDIVQEAWLRWQRQDPAGVRSPRAWLVATTTRLCIDQLRATHRERTDYYGVWLPEPLVETAAPPDEAAALADSLTMAFMLLLERLSPPERAVFLLREAFAYDYAEIAGIVDKSEANCRQIVSRARAQLDRAPPQPAPPSDRAESIVRQFLTATTTGDVRRLLALLTDDATLFSDGGGRVAAAGRPIRSADHISRFFVGIRRRVPVAAEVRLARINGRAGALVLAAGRVTDALSFDLRGQRIHAIFLVRNPEKLRHLAGGPCLAEPTR
ncbi:MAG: RNA polymerase sigma-70 factor [Opitutae bacterium]|nr:RNA polymerase sigma-70 factor [Opitutae bacterium]